MAPRIVVVPPSHAETAEIAKKMAPAGFEIVMSSASPAELMPAMASAEYIVCYPNVASNDAFFKSAPKLKLYQLLSAGYDDVDIEAARRAKVPVCNNGGANAISVSEHAIMLMLTVSRRVMWQHDNVSDGRWRGNAPAPRMYELYDKTLGIVGLGTIGKKVARIARALRHARAVLRHRAAAGARGGRARRQVPAVPRAAAHVRHRDPARAAERFHPPHDRRGGACADEAEAIIVNTCRGPVIDEAALTKALADNKLFGAGLDVFDQEPPPPDNPLFKLDNVVLTLALRRPHLGQPRGALPQRVRQRAARRARREGAVGGAGTGGAGEITAFYSSKPSQRATLSSGSRGMFSRLTGACASA